MSSAASVETIRRYIGCPCCSATCVQESTFCTELNLTLATHTDCDCGYIKITDGPKFFCRRSGGEHGIHGKTWITGCRETKKLSYDEMMQIIESRSIK